MKLAFSLSGGGVRAAAQLGIIKALYEIGIKPEIFVGTSGGSIVATLLALGYEPDKAYEFFKKTHNIFDFAYWEIIKGITTKSNLNGLVKGKRLEDALDIIFEGKKVYEVPNSLAIVSTDIATGKQIVFSNREQVNPSKLNDTRFEWINKPSADIDLKLKDIVRASCNFPAVFIPKPYGDYILVDGGLVNNIPSDLAQVLGADRIISIDLGKLREQYVPNGIISILSRTFNIIYQRDEDVNQFDYDLYINPNVDDIGVFQMTEIDECFQRGYDYGTKIADEIKSNLDNNSGGHKF